MGLLRTPLIGLLATALLAGGMLPPEHLHHATATNPLVVHSHFATSHAHRAALVPMVLHAEDDDFDAVSLDGLTVSRVPGPAVVLPGLVPHTGWVPPAFITAGTVVACPPRASESPPPRLHPTRAPPAS